ncbi:hypothetical protein IEQ34_016561 [Dendrobium chrysotoxum]|uniref:Wound-induced protein 1 n=1 Tax=Dendrobium chrysotoxum TaxID=161865 RepID=A0AAV7GGQ5_DENCH|nr:hypothetical protein IEQ34_016561 [Dendrobium chrysotoxum]
MGVRGEAIVHVYAQERTHEQAGWGIIHVQLRPKVDFRNQALRGSPELAKSCEIDSADDAGKGENNRDAILHLYKALENRDGDQVQKLLPSHLEVWFHGPPSHQHLKLLLTGEDDNFHFLIHSVEPFGRTVLAEGTDPTGSVFWVHAWTVSDGVITRVREYINTAVTVTRITGRYFPVWRSKLSRNAGKSLPGLVLAL